MQLMLSRRGNGQQVNSVFGEGVNPRLRNIRDALGLLGLPVDQLLDHGAPRLVYGVKLASNLRDYLLGLDRKPRYLLSSGGLPTDAVVKWWIERWMSKRVSREDVRARIAAQTLVRPVRHGARVPLPRLDLDQQVLFRLE